MRSYCAAQRKVFTGSLSAMWVLLHRSIDVFVEALPKDFDQADQAQRAQRDWRWQLVRYSIAERKPAEIYKATICR